MSEACGTVGKTPNLKQRGSSTPRAANIVVFLRCCQPMSKLGLSSDYDDTAAYLRYIAGSMEKHQPFMDGVVAYIQLLNQGCERVRDTSLGQLQQVYGTQTMGVWGHVLQRSFVSLSGRGARRPCCGPSTVF